MNLFYIKIFPAVGDCFVIGIPEYIKDVDLFLDEHLKNVDFWEPLEV